jgi:V/A-type H+/Na+-transporting ATPase subunit I
MIIDVQKYLIFGLDKRKEIDDFFIRAQEEGFIEFITPKKKRPEIPDLQKVVKAVKIIRKLIDHPEYKTESPIDPMELVDRINHAYQSIENLEEEKRIISNEIARVSPFGDFSLEDMAFIDRQANRYLQFFFRRSKKEKEDLPEDMIYIGTEYDLDYFVLITKEKQSFSDFQEMQIEKPLGALKARLEMVQEKIQFFHKQLRELGTYLPVLQNKMVQIFNETSLKEAKSLATNPNDYIFSVEAWVPVNKTKAFEALLEPFQIDFAKIAVEEHDKVPTYMENENFSKLGEDLVHVYDTPSTEDKDPSGWVFWFFALFFGMIISDGGYGFIYLLLGLFLYFKFPHWTGAKKRFTKLLLTLSCFCMGWGLLTASFFGIDFNPDNPIKRYSLIHQIALKKASYHMRHQDETYQEWVQKYPKLKQARSSHEFLTGAVEIREGKKHYEVLEDFYNAFLMEFSLLIGVIHICISLLRTVRMNLAHIGWLFFIIGGYLFFPSILQATSIVHYVGQVSKEWAFTYGEWILYGGLTGAFFLSLITKKLAGLLEPMNAIQIFADILSYLRLYALGLAGMIMASTFNGIAESMGWFFGFFVVVIGHATNILLCVMSGVIHGLRLNFLEWYHYSFEGGGKLFNPLRLIKK